MANAHAFPIPILPFRLRVSTGTFDIPARAGVVQKKPGPLRAEDPAGMTNRDAKDYLVSTRRVTVWPTSDCSRAR